MNKRIYPLLLILLAYYIGTAQNPDQKVRIGISLGPEFYSRIKPLAWKNESYIPRLGFEFGGSARFRISRSLEFQAFLSTSLARYRYSFVDDQLDPIHPTTMIVTYHDQLFRLSAFMRFNFQGGDRGFFATMGPEIFKAYAPQTTYRFYKDGIEINAESSIPQWFAMVGSVQLSFGYQKDLKDHLIWSVEPFGRMMLLDANFFRHLYWPLRHISAGVRCAVHF